MKRPQPQPPHRRGTFHRRLQPLYTEKHKVSCSGFSPTQSRCNIMQPFQCDLPPQLQETHRTTRSGAHRWPYGFVHFHLSFDTNVWMVIWQILHAGHSKCMYSFTCPCSYLGVSYFDVEKNYFSWDTFRCIYFSAWLLFSSTFNLQKVETVAREPRLDSFPKVHGFSMHIETLLKTHAHARLRHLLFYVFKKTGNSRKKMCWIPRKDLMTYHPRCVEFQEKISWRTIPDVLNSKKRSHDVPSQMCWIPRKDLMT